MIFFSEQQPYEIARVEKAVRHDGSKQPLGFHSQVKPKASTNSGRNVGALA